MLLDNGESPYLLELNASGDIGMQNSYPLIGPGQESHFGVDHWDGNVKGHKAPMGAYVYVLTLQTLNGKRKVQKGLIN